MKNPLQRTVGRLGIGSAIVGVPDLEFMNELAPPSGLEKFYKMSVNDPIVGGLMLEIQGIIRALEWTVEGDNAEELTSIINSLKPNRLLYEISSSAIFGFYMGEVIWKRQNNRFTIIDIEPRYQPTINNIKDVVEQQTSDGTFFIPYDKCLHITLSTVNRSQYGQSLLRHLYKPYYYKISIEAAESVGVDRDLSGLPMLEAPEDFNFTQADEDSPDYDENVAATLDWAVDLVGNVCKDNQQGIVIPNGWRFSIIRGENRTEIPTTAIIQRYNTEMAVGLLANFLSIGKVSQSAADGEISMKTFIDSINNMRFSISEPINDLIQKYCRINKLTSPTFRIKKANATALEKLASYISRLTAQGIISPTTTLEKEVLSAIGFPYSEDKKNVPKE